MAPDPPQEGSLGRLLSLSMIVRNEEQLLPGCLESVQGLVDEIVIVDTGSHDRTVALARGFGARVIPMEWSGDFSAARNLSLSHCSGEWILCLDADERLSRGQSGSLPALLKSTDVMAYTLVVRSNVTDGGTGGVQVMTYPRLFRNRRGIRFEGRIHEQIGPSLAASGGKVGSSELVIEHLGYGLDPEIMLEKRQRNLRLLREQLQQNPHDAYARYQIGNLYVLLREYQEAERQLRLALDSPGISPSLRASMLNQMGDLKIRTGRFEQAAEFCRESLRCAPRQSTARWYLAGAQIHLHDYAGALATLDMLLGECDRTRPAGERCLVDLVIDPATILHVRGECQMALGDPVGAVESFYRALCVNPEAGKILTAFEGACERLPAPGPAIERLENLHRTRPDLPAVVVLLARCYWKGGRRDDSLRCLEGVLRDHPGNIEARLRLAREHMELGDAVSAGRLIEEGESAGVCSFELARLGLEVATRRSDLAMALSQLRKMLLALPPGNPLMEKQLRELEAKYAGRLAAGVERTL